MSPLTALCRRSINAKMVIAILAFSALLTGAITLVQLYVEYRQDIADIHRQFATVKNSFVPPIISALWIADQKLIQSHLDGALRLRDMVYLEVVADGEVLTSAGTRPTEDFIQQDFNLFYFYNGSERTIGILRVVASLKGVYARLWERLLVILVAQGLKTLLVTGFMFALFQYMVTRHLVTLSDYAGGFRLESPFNPVALPRRKTGDELDSLADTINERNLNLVTTYSSLQTELERRKEAERSLQEAYEQMEERVREATAELTGTNLLLHREIKERRQAEEDLRRANRELESFVYTVSHDLRTPLTPIIGYAEYLQQACVGKVNDENLTILGDIEKQSRGMLTLMEDLLALARLGSFEVPTVPTNAHSVLIQSIQLLCPKLPEKIVLETSLPPVYMQESLLAQIFNNLLGNALKYAGDNETPVEVGSEKADEKVRIYVRDHGPGIPEAERSHIFEVFYRGHGSEEAGGTGVGLAIVEKILRLHGGRIWLEETSGGGCTFWIELPYTA